MLHKPLEFNAHCDKGPMAKAKRATTAEKGSGGDQGMSDRVYDDLYLLGEELVLKYLTQQNRPYSASINCTILHKFYRL